MYWSIKANYLAFGLDKTAHQPWWLVNLFRSSVVFPLSTVCGKGHFVQDGDRPIIVGEDYEDAMVD
jgi:hypothetical protein